MAHLCSNDNQNSLLDYANKCNREKFRSEQELKRDRLANERLFMRRLHQERREAELEEAVVRSQEMKVLAAEQCKQEESLAREVARIKRQEILEKKQRQLVRESSHEIKALEDKLRAAYCVKALQAQIAEKEAERIKNKEDEKLLFQQLEAARMKEADFLKHKEEMESKRKHDYKRELQEQIITSHQMKLCMYEEYLREKKMIDDVVQRLHEEDMRELELKMEKKNRTRREMEEFKCAQEIWRKREREFLEEEQRRVAKEAAKTRDNEKERLARWKEKEAAKMRVQAYIMKNIEEERKRKEDRRNMLDELAAEEAKQKNEDEEKKEIEMKLRKRIKMREALDQQRYFKMLQLKRQEEEDASYRRQELARLAEMAKLDQMSDAKRRMKQLDHGRAVEAMIVDRRRRRAEEMAQLVEMNNMEKNVEMTRQRMIEEERIRLLKEHAQNLAGYLPPGVLKPEDKEILEELLICSKSNEETKEK